MSVISQKHKTGLIVIAILAFMRFVVMPWIEWSNAKAANISQLNTSVARFSDIQKRQQQLSAREEQLAASINALKGLTGELDMYSSSEALRIIEGLAQKNNIQLRSRMPGQATVQPVPHIPVAINAVGAPEAIYQFVADLEQNQPRVVIAQLVMRKAGLTAQELNANINLLVLVQEITAEPAL